MTARTDRRIALLVGGALALLFTVLAAASVAGHTVGSVERTDHRVIAAPVGELFLETHSGDVTIVPAAGDDVTIDSRAKGSLHTPRLDVRVIGTSVLVNGGCPEVNFGHCSATLVVRVPAGTPVQVESSSGDVEVTGLSGNAEVRTASGDVRARDLAGAVTLETGSGDIDGAGLRARMMRAHTGSGDVDLGFTAAPESAAAETGSGDVRITVPRGPERYRVEYETGSGDPTIGVPDVPTATRELRARTGSGDVEIDYAG